MYNREFLCICFEFLFEYVPIASIEDLRFTAIHDSEKSECHIVKICLMTTGLVMECLYLFCFSLCWCAVSICKFVVLASNRGFFVCLFFSSVPLCSTHNLFCFHILFYLGVYFLKWRFVFIVLSIESQEGRGRMSIQLHILFP